MELLLLNAMSNHCQMARRRSAVTRLRTQADEQEGTAEISRIFGRPSRDLFAFGAWTQR